jgi:hypothetical protein
LCIFRYSPHRDLVGCTNGRAVMLNHVKDRTLSFDAAVAELRIDRPTLDELLMRYQRRARDVIVYWSAAGYRLVPMAADIARRMREE